jgi:nitrogen fixation-related uncharacterized protein
MLAVLIGLALVIVAVVEWLGHVTVIHAVAILTLVIGVSLVLGAVGERGGRWTRL